MPGHYKLVCEFCETIIAQCRCMDCNKAIIYDICEKCAEERNLEKPKNL